MATASSQPRFGVIDNPRRLSYDHRQLHVAAAGPRRPEGRRNGAQGLGLTYTVTKIDWDGGAWKHTGWCAGSRTPPRTTSPALGSDGRPYVGELNGEPERPTARVGGRSALRAVIPAIVSGWRRAVSGAP
ncbi:hypothetical protein [Streptomyces sp. TRM68367]|uniref:hypothetical protein n=1 Tax=Streptomyces sp. TRM68367 TaxID=2758415 RepID=UPI00165CEBDF|nr:hypothetical protein [Streptomyces sp. TRM68367]MBC9725761.1 hypothetical protein [Streptomyces sp. TRM68367]